MTTKLSNLRIDRVAMVDQGADQDAHMVMFKRFNKEDDGKRSATTGKAVSKEDGNMPDLKLEALPEALREHFDVEGMTQEAVDAIAASHTAAADAVPEATQKIVDEQSTKLKEAEKALSNKSDDDDEDDDVTKGLTPEAAAFVKAATDKATDLEKRFEAEVEKREMRDATEIAKAQYANVPGLEPAVMGPILYRMEKNTLTDDDRDKLTEALTAANNMVKTNTLLTQELGRSSAILPGDDDTIQKLAKRFESEDSELTKEQAYDKALQTPEGAAAYAAGRADRMATVSD